MNELPKQRRSITSRGRVIADIGLLTPLLMGDPQRAAQVRYCLTTFGGVLHSSLVMLDGAILPTTERQD
jgi:hypothetical protein